MTNSIRIILCTAALTLSLSGCGDSGSESTGSDTSGETDPSAGSDSGTSAGPMGFALGGLAVDLFTGDPYMPAEGAVCVSIVDPVQSNMNGEIAILASSTVETDGKWFVDGIMAPQETGLIVLVHDCDNSGTLVLPSGSGVGGDRYKDLGPGGMFMGFNAWVLTAEKVTVTDDSLLMAGASGTIAADGAVIGYVLDANMQPVPGATVSCDSCSEVFYGDDMHDDGIFSSMGNVNAETSPTGLFVIPSGPIGEYSVSHPSLNYDPLMLGTFPGMSLTVLFFAK